MARLGKILNSGAKIEIGLQADENSNLLDPDQSVRVIADHFFVGSKPIKRADSGPWSSEAMLTEFGAQRGPKDPDQSPQDASASLGDVTTTTTSSD